MKIINPKAEIITPINGAEILRHIEKCGRVCYKSEDQITDASAEKFCAGILKRGHEAVIEHFNITVKFTCDRGVSHEIVRHRIASFCQESTRYCNYTGDKFGNELTVIKPCFWDEGCLEYEAWKGLCEKAEEVYLGLIRAGATPQMARSILPNSLKTEVIMTANLREWRHFFKLRTSPAAHPQMKQVADYALYLMKKEIPVIFDDLGDGVAQEDDCGPDYCDVSDIVGGGD